MAWPLTGHRLVLGVLAWLSWLLPTAARQIEFTHMFTCTHAHTQWDAMESFFSFGVVCFSHRSSVLREKFPPFSASDFGVGVVWCFSAHLLYMAGFCDVIGTCQRWNLCGKKPPGYWLDRVQGLCMCVLLSVLAIRTHSHTHMHVRARTHANTLWWSSHRNILLS